MERLEHLVDALRRVFADVHAAAEDFARGIDGDELDVVAFAGENDAVGDFAEHGFVEEVMLGAIESEAGDAVVNAKFYELKVFRVWTDRSGFVFIRGNMSDHAVACLTSHRSN